jgi:phosphate transport system permease protein
MATTLHDGAGIPERPPPSRFAGRRRSEAVARGVAVAGALALLVVLAAMLVRLGQVSAPVWHAHGLAWIVGRTWAPTKGHFGALPFVFGTLVTSAIALLIAGPIGIGTALFIAELAPAPLRRPIGGLIDLLAAVPSVIYGLWGIFVLIPLMRPLESRLAGSLGAAIPLLSGPSFGASFLVAGIVLAIMILPTVSAVSREVFLTIPADVKEAALALGSTRWEAIRIAVLPPSRQGLVGALILGLGRALGETIAVVMVVGATPTLGASILKPGYTMASVIANEFLEATQPLYLETLIAIGLVLFVITIVVNAAARLLVRTTAAGR